MHTESATQAGDVMAGLVISGVALFAIASSAIGARSSPACLASRQHALIAGGFSGPTDCEKFGSTFRLVGRTSPAGYAIYDYRYRFMPHPGGIMHGGQRIVIFRGSRYIGQYTMSPPPYVSVTMRWHQLVLRELDTGRRAVLDMDKGLPASVTINGETSQLYK